MSDEKRELDELLKEVDEFFKKHELSDAVDSFLKSEPVISRISAATDELIGNMNKLIANAPTDDVKKVATHIMSEFNSKNRHCILEDVYASFKVSFAKSLELVTQLTDDPELQELFIESAKAAIPGSGMKDIDEICSTMVERNSYVFMRDIYRDFTPEGIPNEVLSFLRMLLGGPMIPITAVFPELLDDKEDEKP